MVYSLIFSSRSASVYGSGAYNSSSYNGAATTGGAASTSTATPAATGPGSLLANTGFDVLLVVSLACLIIFIALIVRYWKRPKPG